MMGETRVNGGFTLLASLMLYRACQTDCHNGRVGRGNCSEGHHVVGENRDRCLLFPGQT
jgi:hypothetical protein